MTVRPHRPRRHSPPRPPPRPPPLPLFLLQMTPRVDAQTVAMQILAAAAVAGRRRLLVVVSVITISTRAALEGGPLDQIRPNVRACFTDGERCAAQEIRSKRSALCMLVSYFADKVWQSVRL